MNRAWINGLISLRWLASLCLGVVLLGVSFIARAEVAPTFEGANKLYEEGKFADAAAAYDKLALSGQTSAALYFNMGNAFFKAGQLGRAIAAYRQAEQISPRDPDVRANLQFARKQPTGPSLQVTPLQQWLGRLSLNEWTLLTAAAVWILFLLLGAGQWWPNARSSMRNFVILAALAAVVLVACLGADYYQTRMNRTAIVIVRDAIIRLGPLTESQEAFTAHDGAELRVVDQKDEWLAVTAGPGRFGWVRRDQVQL